MIQQATKRVASGPIVTLTTDFGPASRYVGAMKGVIYSINPRARVIDFCHAVPPQDVLNGARTLADAVRWFPPGVIHLAVIDPGVGGDRQAVCASLPGGHVVCPNNGLLTFLVTEGMRLRLHALQAPAYRLSPVSATFHGRDIMAPAAAHLSRGVKPASLGPPATEPVLLDPQAATHATPQPHAAAGCGRGPQAAPFRVEGRVVEVDSFGNLITSIGGDVLAGIRPGAPFIVACKGHRVSGLIRTYSDRPPMTLVALIGSGGLLELAIVNGNASATLGAGRGARVTVEWTFET